MPSDVSYEELVRERAALDAENVDQLGYARLIKARLAPVFGPSFDAYRSNPKPPRSER
jgi:hypothetical protein